MINSGSEVQAHLVAIGCNGQEISRAHLAAIGCNGLKQGRPESIHHVNDVRWTRVGRRGGGAQLPKQRTGPSVRALNGVFRLQTLA